MGIHHSLNSNRSTFPQNLLEFNEHSVLSTCWQAEKLTFEFTHYDLNSRDLDSFILCRYLYVTWAIWSFSRSVKSLGSWGPLHVMAVSRMWAIMGPCLSTGRLSTRSGAPPRPVRLAPSPRAGARKKPWVIFRMNTINTFPPDDVHLVIQHVRGVGRHPTLHQLGELADVHPPSAEPGEHARVTPDKGLWSLMSESSCHLLGSSRSFLGLHGPIQMMVARKSMSRGREVCCFLSSSVILRHSTVTWKVL